MASFTASSAMTRYVVYFPPAIDTKPGAGLSTTCSRESFVVGDSGSVETKGRSPAKTPMT